MKKHIVYIDGTDWLYEIGESSNGNKVYPSVRAININESCVVECGIVEAELKFIKWIQKPNYKSDLTLEQEIEYQKTLKYKKKHIKHLQENIKKAEHAAEWYKKKLEEVLKQDL